MVLITRDPLIAEIITVQIITVSHAPLTVLLYVKKPMNWGILLYPLLQLRCVCIIFDLRNVL